MLRLFKKQNLDTQKNNNSEVMLNELKSEQAHIKFPPEMLIEIIKSTQNPEIRGTAYGVLMAKGSMRQLQELEHLIDFKFREHPTTSYLSCAVIYGRDDVLKWLSNKNEFINISDTDKMELVLHAVQNEQAFILKLLVDSEQDGGFGFPIDFQHRGFSPVKLAALQEAYSMLYLLTTSRKKDGFGLGIDKESLKLIEKENRYFISGKPANEYGQLAYRRAKPGRQHSFIEMRTTKTSDGSLDIERYSPHSTLGSGRYGSVRLFVSEHDPDHKLVVKQPVFSDETQDRYSLFQQVDNIDDEVNIAACAHHQIKNNMFGIKHYIKKDIHRDDYRFIMPYFPGTTFYKKMQILNNFGEFLKILIAIAKSLQEIHRQSVIHVDIKPDNILIEEMNADRFLVEIKAHFIDFGSSETRGMLIGPYGEKFTRFAPEIRTRKAPAHPSSDVFAFASMVRDCIKYLTETKNKICPELNDHHDDAISRLINKGTADDPVDRPQLSDVISDLENDLALWSQHNKTNSISYISK